VMNDFARDASFAKHLKMIPVIIDESLTKLLIVPSTIDMQAMGKIIQWRTLF